jgi:predicted ester cyclase
MPKQPQGENTAEIRERNKAAARRILEAFNSGDLGIVAEVTEQDVLDYDECPGTEVGIEGLRQQIMMIHEQFPDVRFTEELIMAEGNMVFLRWKMTGTNTGPIFGREPTGKFIVHHGHEMIVFNDRGMISEHIDTNDIMIFLDKLGVLDDRMMGFLERIGVRVYEAA